MKTKKIVLSTWAASIITKVIYVFMATNFGGDGLSESIPNILNFIGAIAFASAILSYYLSSSRYRSTKIYKSKFFNSQISSSTNSASEKSGVDTVYMLLSMFSLAFTENVALFGFVGFMISSNRKFFISLMLVAIILWILSYPRHNKFEEIKEKLKTEI